jgi:exodeoxyribonuclease VII small subunit
LIQKARAAVTQKKSKIPKSTKFEDALGELETIVSKLETGEQSLDDSLAQFERGVSLARFCQQSLQDAEQKVKVLMDKNGEATLEDLDTSE